MMPFKKMIWRLTPAFTHRWLRNVFFAFHLLPNVWYDTRRYFIYSGINKSRQYQGEQAARITMAYHQLEKGLSYAVPRPNFGQEVVARLLVAVEPFIARYGFIAPATTALGVLDAYVAFNEAAGVDMTVLKARIAGLSKVGRDVLETCREGGTISVSRTELEARRASGFKDFFNSRYSVRNFSEGSIPEVDVVEAISIAQKTPSVCNRQAWKVHAYSEKVDMDRLLAIQSGSRGFGEQASTVLVVTCDLTRFVDVAERYQAWIDGGMFSMSVCLAFHSLGYGTCCLNWSKERGDDIALRKVTGIKPEEQVMMMIAVGTLPDYFKVAYSARRSLDEVLQVH